jgi:hypothetical protein
MKALKDLVIAVKTQPALIATPEVKAAVETAVDFLDNIKSFEYGGQLKLSGSVIKLTDISMDFDDVIKQMAGKPYNIDVQCGLFLYLLDTTEPTATPTGNEVVKESPNVA